MLEFLEQTDLNVLELGSIHKQKNLEPAEFGRFGRQEAGWRLPAPPPTPHPKWQARERMEWEWRSLPPFGSLRDALTSCGWYPRRSI